ncbi:MAG: hypothetical protein AAB263_01670 [Planctomycetota bacterium]
MIELVLALMSGIRPICFLAVALLWVGCAARPPVSFDVHIDIPTEYLNIGLIYDGPLERYIAGYRDGVREALRKRLAGELLEPEKVSGWGYFIGGHDAGFANIKRQIERNDEQFGHQHTETIIRNMLDTN